MGVRPVVLDLDQGLECEMIIDNQLERGVERREGLEEFRCESSRHFFFLSFGKMVIQVRPK